MANEDTDLPIELIAPEGENFTFSSNTGTTLLASSVNDFETIDLDNIKPQEYAQVVEEENGYITRQRYKEIIDLNSNSSQYVNLGLSIERISNLFDDPEGRHIFPYPETPTPESASYSTLSLNVNLVSEHLAFDIFDNWFNGILNSILVAITDASFVERTNPNTDLPFDINILDFNSVIENYSESKLEGSNHLVSAVEEFFGKDEKDSLKILSMDMKDVDITSFVPKHAKKFIKFHLGGEAKHTVENCTKYNNFLTNEVYDVQVQDNFFASLIFVASVYRIFYVVHLGPDSFSFIYNDKDLRSISLNHRREDHTVPGFRYEDMGSYISNFVDEYGDLFDREDYEIYHIVFSFVSQIRRSLSNYVYVSMMNNCIANMSDKWQKKFNNEIKDINQALKTAESSSTSSAYGWA